MEEIDRRHALVHIRLLRPTRSSPQKKRPNYLSAIAQTRARTIAAQTY